MDRPAAQLLQVGAWCVNPRTGELSRAGEVVRLDERAMRLLLCLAERAGEVVSSEELLKLVWSGVVVTQDSVYQAVASLRRILGDDPRQPAYIATVPRLGYRLVAPVGPWANESSVPIAPIRSPWLMRHRTGVIVALLGFLCVASAGVYLAGRAAPSRSVAVLPFLDLTTERMDKEYLADGITEELIGKLSRVPGLKVPSPTASFFFKDKKIALADEAAKLGVVYLLDGSIRESKDTLRIAARLVRASDGYVIWSDTYDRPLGDELAVQEGIAREVVEQVRHAMR